MFQQLFKKLSEVQQSFFWIRRLRQQMSEMFDEDNGGSKTAELSFVRELRSGGTRNVQPIDGTIANCGEDHALNVVSGKRQRAGQFVDETWRILGADVEDRVPV